MWDQAEDGNGAEWKRQERRKKWFTHFCRHFVCMHTHGSKCEHSSVHFVCSWSEAVKSVFIEMSFFFVQHVAACLHWEPICSFSRCSLAEGACVYFWDYFIFACSDSFSGVDVSNRDNGGEDNKVFVPVGGVLLRGALVKPLSSSCGDSCFTEGGALTLWFS